MADNGEVPDGNDHGHNEEIIEDSHNTSKTPVADVQHHTDSGGGDSVSSKFEEDYNDDEKETEYDRKEAIICDQTKQLEQRNGTDIQYPDLAEDRIHGTLFVRPELIPRESRPQLLRFLAEHNALLAPTAHGQPDESAPSQQSRRLLEVHDQIIHRLPLVSEWDRQMIRAIIEMLHSAKVNPPPELIHARNNLKDRRIAKYRAHGPQILDKKKWDEYERRLFKLFGGRRKWKKRVTRLQEEAFARARASFNQKKREIRKRAALRNTDKKRAPLAVTAAVMPQRKPSASHDAGGLDIKPEARTFSRNPADSTIDSTNDSTSNNLDIPGPTKACTSTVHDTAQKHEHPMEYQKNIRASPTDVTIDHSVLSKVCHEEEADMMTQKSKTKTTKMAIAKAKTSKAAEQETPACANTTEIGKTRMEQQIWNKYGLTFTQYNQAVIDGKTPMEQQIWNKYRLTFTQYNQAVIDGFTPAQYRQMLDQCESNIRMDDPTTYNPKYCIPRDNSS